MAIFPINFRHSRISLPITVLWSIIEQITWIFISHQHSKVYWSFCLLCWTSNNQVVWRISDSTMAHGNFIVSSWVHVYPSLYSNPGIWNVDNWVYINPIICRRLFEKRLHVRVVWFDSVTKMTMKLCSFERIIWNSRLRFNDRCSATLGNYGPLDGQCEIWGSNREVTLIWIMICQTTPVMIQYADYIIGSFLFIAAELSEKFLQKYRYLK